MNARNAARLEPPNDNVIEFRHGGSDGGPQTAPQSLGCIFLLASLHRGEIGGNLRLIDSIISTANHWYNGAPKKQQDEFRAAFLANVEIARSCGFQIDGVIHGEAF